MNVQGLCHGAQGRKDRDCSESVSLCFKLKQQRWEIPRPEWVCILQTKGCKDEAQDIWAFSGKFQVLSFDFSGVSRG